MATNMIDTIVNSFDVWTDAQGVKSRTRINSVNNISLEGIAKLRELILDLAVSGKLVLQDPKEEPASELLKKIELEKQLLIKERKLSPQKKRLQISDVEKPFKLSQSWEWVRLTDIGNIFNGNSIDATTKELKYTNNSGIPYISTKDVGHGWDILNYNNGISIPEDEINFKLARKGSVLICAEGGSAGKKCGITNRDIYFGNKLFAIELLGSIPSNYILSNYLSSIFSRQFKSKLTGIIGGISIQKFNDIIIPLPPLSEQQRIVTKVDELMALCDKLEDEQFNNLKTHQVLIKVLLETLTQAADANELQAAWERMSPHFDTLFCTEDSIDQLKLTILQLAIMGKLVKQDPKDEPATALIRRIKIEREKLFGAGRLKKEKEIPHVSEEEIPFKLPIGWGWYRLEEVTNNVDYGTSQKAELAGDVPVLRMGNIQDGKIVLGNLKYVSRTIADLPRLFLKNEDLIFNRTNSFELVGKCGVFEGENDQYTLASYLIRVSVFRELVSVHFINSYINSTICRLSQIEPQITQQTGQANFSGSKLKNILFPLPPFSEQQRIVNKLDELFTICESLMKKIQKSNHIKASLSKTIVEKAVQ